MHQANNEDIKYKDSTKSAASSSSVRGGNAELEEDDSDMGPKKDLLELIFAAYFRFLTSVKIFDNNKGCRIFLIPIVIMV